MDKFICIGHVDLKESLSGSVAPTIKWILSVKWTSTEMKNANVVIVTVNLFVLVM